MSHVVVLTGDQLERLVQEMSTDGPCDTLLLEELPGGAVRYVQYAGGSEGERGTIDLEGVLTRED